jgi:hypothetical protein
MLRLLKYILNSEQHFSYSSPDYLTSRLTVNQVSEGLLCHRCWYCEVYKNNMRSSLTANFVLTIFKLWVLASLNSCLRFWNTLFSKNERICGGNYRWSIMRRNLGSHTSDAINAVHFIHEHWRHGFLFLVITIVTVTFIPLPNNSCVSR